MSIFMASRADSVKVPVKKTNKQWSLGSASLPQKKMGKNYNTTPFVPIGGATEYCQEDKGTLMLSNWQSFLIGSYSYLVDGNE